MLPDFFQVSSPCGTIKLAQRWLVKKTPKICKVSPYRAYENTVQARYQYSVWFPIDGHRQVSLCFSMISRAGHRKFKLNSATAKLQEVFHNRKSTLHFRNLRPQYLLLFCLPVMIFLFWRSNFAVDQTLTSKKKGH